MMLLSEDLFKEAKIDPGAVVSASVVGTERGALAANVLMKARENSLAIIVDVLLFNNNNLGAPNGYSQI